MHHIEALITAARDLLGTEFDAVARQILAAPPQDKDAALEQYQLCLRLLARVSRVARVA